MVSDKVAFYLPVCLICTQIYHMKNWDKIRGRRNKKMSERNINNKICG